MRSMKVRIESIEINNFKNVKKGEVTLINEKVGYDASVLGIYGQNGSGKTALIDATELLRLVLSGKSIDRKYVDFINVESESATLKFVFQILSDREDGLYKVYYEFSLKGQKADAEINNMEIENTHVDAYKAQIFNESFSYEFKHFEDKKHNIKKQPAIITQASDAFTPKTKFDMFTNKKKESEMDFLVAKKVALSTSRSFIFSADFLRVVRENSRGNRANTELQKYCFLLDSLAHYGNFNLYVINMQNSALIGLNALPLSFIMGDDKKGTIGNIMLPLMEKATIPEEAVEIAEKIIGNMNIVLKQLIPGLTIGIKKVGTQALKDGKIGVDIELISYKNSKEIPLRYESDGTKKIISILQLLIAMYNNPSVTIVIDELDSGIFEYLLGELLKIISEKGKGQLIFTSHNLRALETLDKSFVSFTTTNPENRYIRLAKVKANNNLRDFYYRDIVLGEQSEEVYDFTNNYEIALAFREAGDFNDT